MVKFEISAHINRPLAEVFKYMADPTKLPEWNSIVEEATASETPMRVGTRVQQRARFLGRKIEWTLEVTEHELNKRFVQKTEEAISVCGNKYLRDRRWRDHGYRWLGGRARRVLQNRRADPHADREQAIPGAARHGEGTPGSAGSGGEVRQVAGG